MKCPKCSFENELGKDICTNCGENLKKQTIRSNNGFEEVDLDVLQQQAVEQPQMVEQPKATEELPQEQPIMMPLNSDQTPPAIGKILQSPTPAETPQIQQTQQQAVFPAIEQPKEEPKMEEQKKEEQPVLEKQILEPMHKNPTINWKDKGLLAIFGCGILAFAVIGTLITMSISSVNNPEKTKTNIKYREIQGEWIDNSKKNLFVISNNSYTWYQDYSNDKSNLTTGEVKILEGKKALNYLDISVNTAKQLLNITEESDVKEFYSLKLFTSAKEHNHAYYKMLFYVKEDGIICYNFNDKQLYFLYKNN